MNLQLARKREIPSIFSPSMFQCFGGDYKKKKHACNNLAFWKKFKVNQKEYYLGWNSNNIFCKKTDAREDSKPSQNYVFNRQNFKTPSQDVFHTWVCICAWATGAQKDRRITLLADAPTELAMLCLVITKLLSAKWFKMFDKPITKPSKEMLPFQGLESWSRPLTLAFVSDSAHISNRKLLTDRMST